MLTKRDMIQILIDEAHDLTGLSNFEILRRALLQFNERKKRENSGYAYAMVRKSALIAWPPEVRDGERCRKIDP